MADWWLQTRADFPEAFWPGFDSLVLLVSWIIWKERNRRTFDHLTRTTTHVLAVIYEEADACVAARFRALASLLAMVT
jgi:hypothetical protein